MALFALRPMWGLWIQWRLRRVGLSPVPASVAQYLDDLTRRLGLRRTSDRTIGARRRADSRRLLASADSLARLRAHRAHHGPIGGPSRARVGPRSAARLAGQRITVFVETVFFYHPAVWWLSRQIRQERENCCDDLAVSLVGDRGTVGRMLSAIEGCASGPPAWHLPRPAATC